jgi:mRNA interferase MazF
MTSSKYIPSRGDIVWLNFTPQAGHEQSGKRPAIVISPKQYNAKVGLALFQPITSKQKGYPFEVELPKNIPITGVILSDQIKSLDWKIRNIEFICNIPQKYYSEAIDKLKVLIQ